MGSEALNRQIGWDPSPEQGWVAPHIAAEFPGLGIAWIEVDSRPGRSPEPVRRRLRDLSDRFYGAQAIHMRERPIPWAYRVFFRKIGLDPARNRTPIGSRRGSPSAPSTPTTSAAASAFATRPPESPCRGGRVSWRRAP